MKAIDGLGLFWLTGHEEDALSGRLQFDPKGGGTTLSLVGTFDNAPYDGGEPMVRIMGWLGTIGLTLDRCYSSGTNRRSPGVAESGYYANQLFMGHHLEQRDLEFRSATITLSDLDSWVGKSGIVEERDHTGDRSQDSYSMAFTSPTDESHEFSRGRVKLGFGWTSGGDPIQGITFRQWPGLTIEYDDLQEFRIIQDDIGRLQNLVTLCVDAPVMLDSFALKRPDIRAKLLSGKDSPYEQPIEFLAPPIRYVDPHERKPRHWHQMLLSYDELGGTATIARWLDLSERFHRALDSFMSIKHASQMFAENRFLNVTFAAEAFHRITQGGTHMDDESFMKLLTAYLESTPEVHHDWLRQRIEHGNEPTLRKRLQQLAARSGPATRPLIGEKGRWAHTLSQVRNELTHLGTNSREFAGSDLIFLTESVYAVVRICMLLECGVPLEKLIEKANSPTMTWYRERLKGSIERVRRQFANP